jgi:hypothetical protein
MPETRGPRPLTCEWCRRRPADHLLVYDYHPRGTPAGVTDRLKAFICGFCGHRDEDAARQMAVNPSAAWLYRLIPEVSGASTR